MNEKTRLYLKVAGSWAIVDSVGYTLLFLVNTLIGFLDPSRVMLSPILMLSILQPLLFLTYRRLVRKQLRLDESESTIPYSWPSHGEFKIIEC